MSTPSILPIQISRDLNIKPVMGEGREERWKAVQNMIRTKIEPIYGDQSELLKNVVDQPEQFKCRILLAGDTPVGTLFYEGRTTERYNQDGLTKCMKINMLHSNASNQEDLQAHLKALIEYAVTTAKELKGNSLSIRVKKSHNIRYFLETNNFHSLRANEDLLFLGKSLVESDTKKRSTIEDDHSSKRQRITTTNERPAVEHTRIPHPDDIKRRLRGEPVPPPQPARYQGNHQNGEPPRLTSTTIQMKYLQFIINGRKTVEGRINTGMFARLQEGERIQFFCQETKSLCEVVRLTKYSSFKEMLKAVGYAACIPDATSEEAAVRIYDNIPGYAEKARKFGVIAIHIRRV